MQQRKPVPSGSPQSHQGPPFSQWGYSSGAEFALAVECSSEQMHLESFGRPAESFF
ncbi:hypothetical protein THARTR1_00290 [Trichoderma harzianum]|uniref:Uncharacterized protein n=1 Tax=Trichoderma harzianum TaxID=5544 RepID=A0A2K0UR66_TRIHA|nr:hypothetical protein THARTR1_00290 [Trichoderma harzianum]